MSSAIYLRPIAGASVVGCCFALTFLLAVPTQAQEFLARLESPVFGERLYGERAAISGDGDTVAVAARGRGFYGAVDVFERDDDTAGKWGRVATLEAFGGPSGDAFGFDLAFSGDTLIVIEHRGPRTTAFPESSFYVFERDRGGTGAWEGVARVSPSPGTDLSSVDIDGDTAISGSSYGNHGAGVAWIFERNEGGPDQWGQVIELSASGVTRGDAFGYRVAISGDTALVQSGKNFAVDSLVPDFYIFERNEGGPDNWGEVKKLAPSDFGPDAAGGGRSKGIDIVGDTAIVGAYWNNVVAPYSGSAHIFERDEGGPSNWGEVVKLTPSDASEGDGFGFSVALSDNFALVGAPNADHPIAGDDIRGAGAVYVFGRDIGGPNNWGEMLKITAPDADLQGDWFGYSVALSGNMVAVSNDGPAPVYLFELPSPGEPIEILRYPNAIYSASDDDSDSDFNGLGDTTSDLMSEVHGTVGEIDSAISNRLNRVVAKFALPDAPHSMPVLKSATLKIFLEDMEGMPRGSISLFHSVSDNDLDQVPSDYEDETYTDTDFDLVDPTDEAGGYYELDVTDLVLADYAADGDDPISAFRLQITEAVFSEDDQSTGYRFTMPGADGNYPELVLTFVPEPSTLLLATFALTLLCWRRKGR